MIIDLDKTTFNGYPMHGHKLDLKEKLKTLTNLNKKTLFKRT